MRRLLLSGTAALALTTGAALAGGLAEPVMEPEVVEAATSSSSAGIIVPVILLLLIAAAASGGGSDREGDQASDLRLKTDIQWMGMQAGHAVYSWRYRDRPGIWQGVMAQDLLDRAPQAVTPRHDGMLTVDYARLPVPFTRLH